jgi:hypothetical protein
MISWARRRLARMLERAVIKLRPGKQKTSESLEKRLEHLEAMVEGLQDAVYRESTRQGREIEELQKKAEPAEIRRALGQDAREHGI